MRLDSTTLNQAIAYPYKYGTTSLGGKENEIERKSESSKTMEGNCIALSPVGSRFLISERHVWKMEKNKTQNCSLLRLKGRVPQVRRILSPNEAILAPRGPFCKTLMMQKYSLSIFFGL
jgi:hypothetical protein